METMPNYIRGVSAAGVDPLRAAARKFQDWQVLRPIDTSVRDAVALATEYLTKLKYPHHIFGELPEDAQDRVAVAVGCVERAQWVSPPVAPGTPDYKLPSWEGDVYKVLFETRTAPPPAARTEPARRVSHAKAWPELASLAKWRKTKNGASVTEALAKALGADWKPAGGAGTYDVPRVRSAKLGLSFVAIPGGTLQMGLSPDEQRELKKIVKGRGPEANAHARELAKLARPLHAVKLEPFLCAEMPLLARHSKKLRVDGDATNAHHVLRVDSEAAAAVTKKSTLRLLAEAEWEWVARAGGVHAWLSGDDEPETWVERVIATEPSSIEHPLGILSLGWGEWIDDGWHPSYKGAPARATAWEPTTRPEVVRGGGLALWPWQVGGEIILCHAASRDRAGARARHAVRLAQSLPPR